MIRLQEVENAKAVMNQAMEWSVFKWLWEKSAVREIADEANAALDRLNRRVKAQWSQDLKAAHRQLLGEISHTKSSHNHQDGRAPDRVIDPEVMRALVRVKKIDDQAHRARLDAEQTFDEAERQLSTSLAREGCRKAIHSWNLHEKAIREAEALAHINAETNNRPPRALSRTD